MRQLSPLLVSAQPSAWHPHLCLAKKRRNPSFIVDSHEISPSYPMKSRVWLVIRLFPDHEHPPSFPIKYSHRNPHVPMKYAIFRWGFSCPSPVDGEDRWNKENWVRISWFQLSSFQGRHIVYIYNYICKQYTWRWVRNSKTIWPWWTSK
jgi:hypothetical protein